MEGTSQNASVPLAQAGISVSEGLSSSVEAPKSVQLSLWKPRVTSSHADKKVLEETETSDWKKLDAS